MEPGSRGDDHRGHGCRRRGLGRGSVLQLRRGVCRRRRRPCRLDVRGLRGRQLGGGPLGDLAVGAVMAAAQAEAAALWGGGAGLIRLAAGSGRRCVRSPAELRGTVRPAGCRGIGGARQRGHLLGPHHPAIDVRWGRLDLQPHCLDRWGGVEGQQVLIHVAAQATGERLT